jgi:amino acid transporter
MRHIAAAAVLMLALTSPAYAYIGPGAGIGAIGTVVAFFVAVFLLLVGFVWYPLKRLMRRTDGPGSVRKDS